MVAMSILVFRKIGLFGDFPAFLKFQFDYMALNITNSILVWFVGAQYRSLVKNIEVL